jgi:hypothetical protein
MLYLSEYSAGLVYYRTNNLRIILHLLSIIVMLSLFLAHNKRVMLVVPLLNSSIYYFSFTMFMCFFHCLERKHILHRYRNADMSLDEFT